jgi:integrase
LFIGSPFSRA